MTHIDQVVGTPKRGGEKRKRKEEEGCERACAAAPALRVVAALSWHSHDAYEARSNRVGERRERKGRRSAEAG